MKGKPTTFWGKLERSEADEVIAWHPLLAHCADVAACAEALLEKSILRTRLAVLGGKADLDAVDIARLSALAALHDIGKFNVGFQRKADAKPKDVAGHVSEVLALFTSDFREKERLVEALPSSSLGAWGGPGSDAAVELLIASIGHHGKPVACNSHAAQPALWAKRGDLDPFRGIASLTATSSSTKWSAALFVAWAALRLLRSRGGRPDGHSGACPAPWLLRSRGGRPPTMYPCTRFT